MDAPSTVFWVERMSATELWADKFSVWHPIASMETDYLWNVLGYLEQHAEMVRTDYAFEVEATYLPPERMTAVWARAEDIRAKPVLDWLASTPVWQAVIAELVARGELRRREEIWDILAARRADFEHAELMRHLDEELAWQKRP